MDTASDCTPIITVKPELTTGERTLSPSNALTWSLARPFATMFLAIRSAEPRRYNFAESVLSSHCASHWLIAD